MSIQLYDPFIKMDFGGQVCFLSGRETKDIKKIAVFDKWLLDRYKLHDKAFMMLSENKILYPDILIPCSPEVEEKINLLEKQVQIAFDTGFEAVVKLDAVLLFQWMAKIMYGILYNDIAYAQAQHRQKDTPFRLSAYLTKHLRALHCMLQSLLLPMDFTKAKWSLAIVRVSNSKDIFNYKDETKNFNFSLAMNGFGIIACMQDNGINQEYHQPLLEKIGITPLHPIQFEELWCKFLYSNYLIKDKPEYTFYAAKSGSLVEVEVKPNADNNPFNSWDDAMYARVLAEYWKPWGLTVKEIKQIDGSNLSYLWDDYHNKIIDPAQIKLPG
ncbi:MAG: hypothetical protein JSS98_08435 [Bacteroidetes bacterium]|nr:hypothetical protein [Bacteroidota bacterium]